MIANLEIHDPDNYLNYEKGFFPVLKKHGGTFLTFDDDTLHFEGNRTRQGRLVLFQLPSEEAAKAWYNDPEYQAISEHRRESTTLYSLTLLHTLSSKK